MQMRRANSADVPLLSSLPLTSWTPPYFIELALHCLRFMLMSCPVHDRCTCYGASLQYTATMATSTASPSSSQFAPQTNNILVGYEWTAPVVTATSSSWYPLESLMIQPPTLQSGQDTLLQSDSYRLDNGHEASSLHNTYHRESHSYEREQKLALRSREQVRFPRSLIPPSQTKVKFSLQHSTRILRHTFMAFLGWPCPATTPNHWCRFIELIRVARPLVLRTMTDSRNLNLS
jgi:hypothetical protein